MMDFVEEDPFPLEKAHSKVTEKQQLLILYSISASKFGTVKKSMVNSETFSSTENYRQNLVLK